MSTVDDGPAFHCMTLRDVFAAHAMAAMLPAINQSAPVDATLAYEYADAMLEARKVKPATERVPPAPEQDPDPFEPE